VVVVVVVVVVASAVVAAGSAATTVVAIVAVAAEGTIAELASSAAVEPSAASEPHAANSNARIEVPAELVTLAQSIGETWAHAYVDTLRSQERDIVGAWPGTIREARRQVLARVKTKLEPEQLDQLARLTNLAARRGWESVSEPDLES
jgi:hypothetical protein